MRGSKGALHLHVWRDEAQQPAPAGRLQMRDGTSTYSFSLAQFDHDPATEKSLAAQVWSKCA